MTDEQNIAQEENRLIAERREKLNTLREAGNAFPNQFRPTTNARTLLEQYGDLEKEELESQNIQVSVAGRLMLDRKSFKVLQDQRGRIQIYAARDARKDARLWDIGDIVGVTG